MVETRDQKGSSINNPGLVTGTNISYDEYFNYDVGVDSKDGEQTFFYQNRPDIVIQRLEISA